MTAKGVGMLAGLQSGFYESEEKLIDLYKSSRVYKPLRSSAEARKLLAEYKKAVRASEVVSGKDNA